jgi:transcriptional regulator with XRE-family HTH domain
MRLADPDRVVRDVGRRIGELRAERGMTQEQISAQAEVSLKYLQRIESGSENLTLRSLVKFANLLGVPVPVLLEPPVPRKTKVGRPPKARKP